MENISKKIILEEWNFFEYFLICTYNQDPNDIPDGGTIVDFGCGSGNLCLALASFFDDTKFVFVDRNEQSLRLVENRAKAAELENVEFICYDFSPDAVFGGGKAKDGVAVVPHCGFQYQIRILGCL